MTPEIMADLADKVRRQTAQHEGPAALSRKAALAEALVQSEGARAEHAEFVADLLLDRLRWPTTFGPAVVLDLDGRPAPDTTVSDLVKQARSGHGWAFGGGPVKPPTPEPVTLTERAKAERDAQKASPAQASSVEANPYHPATRNLTQQVLLEKNDPTRAARLKAEAGP